LLLPSAKCVFLDCWLARPVLPISVGGGAINPMSLSSYGRQAFQVVRLCLRRFGLCWDFFGSSRRARLSLDISDPGF